MTKRKSRLQKLVRLLDSNENIHLKDAAKILDVSEMTIRRDINSMAGYSPVNLLGGYILLASQQKDASHYFISEQQQRNTEQKYHIGQLAAKLIEENDTVFFDCGTTIPFIAEHIPSDLNFTAVCYSLNVFLSLQKKEKCKLILCGGAFDNTNTMFASLNEHSPLEMICPTKSFISAAGISLKGVTCFNFGETSWKVKAIKRSQDNILVADHSKFDVLRPAYFGELSDFDTLITDTIPNEYREYCQKHQIEIIT